MKKVITMCAVVALAGMSAHADITYVDAVVDVNTVATDGTPSTSWYNPSGSSASQDLWQRRTGFANGSDILQAHGASVAPNDTFKELTTTITGLTVGQQYEIYTFFWDADGTQAWNLDTGTTSGSLTTYSAPDGGAIPDTTDGLASTLTFDAAVLTAEGNRVMHYAFLGLETANASGEIDVYVDNSLSYGGNTRRSWYDGVGYQVPEPATIGLFGLFGAGMLVLRRKFMI